MLRCRGASGIARKPTAPPGEPRVSTDLVAVLDRIVSRHGKEILADRARLNALLRDHAPGDLRGVRVLMTAYDSGVTARLPPAVAAVPPTFLQEETARMVDLFGTNPDLGRIAIETWASFMARMAPKPIPIRPLPLPEGPRAPRPAPVVAMSTPAGLQGKSGLVRWLLITAALLVRMATALRRRRSR